MPLIELPTLRATDVLAVQLEQAELAGTSVWVVTWREHDHSQPCRRWYPDEPSAVAYAAQQADRLGWLLIDLRDSGEPL